MQKPVHNNAPGNTLGNTPGNATTNERFCVAYNATMANHSVLEIPGFEFIPINHVSELAGQPTSALLLDVSLAKTAGNKAGKKILENTFVIAQTHLIENNGNKLADFIDMEIPDGWPTRATQKALLLACQQQTLRQLQNATQNNAVRNEVLLKQLTDVGIALSAEMNHSTLLERILTESRKLAGCDAASLFLLTDNGDAEGEQSLVFKLAQNQSKPIDIEESRLPLNDSSLVGYVATHREEINLADAYAIPADMPFQFNKAIDEKTGYRTASLLALPLYTPQQTLVGVLEFINRKQQPEIILDDPATTLAKTIPFSDDILPVLRALASQAAVAIANNKLINNIHRMFEGFVTASVTAIEARDPTTSGHSFRVATLTTNLAESIPRSGISRFRDIHFNDRQIREINYASLLHDFGKVGVREHILQKEKKLSTLRFQEINHRIELEKERLRVQALEQQLRLVRENRDTQTAQQAILQELDKRIQALAHYWEVIQQANEPSILPEQQRADLDAIRGCHLMDSRQPLLDDNDYRILNIPKGSLTDDERLQIESHVTHTWNFLNRIPWPEDLAYVPKIAGAHHEKLDGKGYPFGLRDDEIPFPAKMMTVSDIYDALTAKDRPYKKAMPTDKALSIIETEAKHGKLDQDIVSVFIDAGIYKATA